MMGIVDVAVPSCDRGGSAHGEEHVSAFADEFRGEHGELTVLALSIASGGPDVLTFDPAEVMQALNEWSRREVRRGQSLSEDSDAKHLRGRLGT